jgi:hypothetical protein
MAKVGPKPIQSPQNWNCKSQYTVWGCEVSGGEKAANYAIREDFYALWMSGCSTSYKHRDWALIFFHEFH